MSRSTYPANRKIVACVVCATCLDRDHAKFCSLECREKYLAARRQRTIAHARASDIDTSHAAALKIGLTDYQYRVLAELRKNGPATCREIAQRSGINLSSVTPRIKPLRQARLVIAHMDELGNPDRRAGQAVWRAVPE